KTAAWREKEGAFNVFSHRVRGLDQAKLDRVTEIVMSALTSGTSVSMDIVVGQLRREGVRPSSLRALAPYMAFRIEHSLSTLVRGSPPWVRSGEVCRLGDALESLFAKLAMDLDVKAVTPQGNRRRRLHALSKRALASAALAVFVSVIPSLSYAGAGDNPFAGLSTVSDDQLAGSRGGFMVEGVDINFGAIVKTVVNGAVVLETQLTATNGALVAVQSGPATTSSTPIPGSPQINVRVVNNTVVAEGTLVPGQNGPSTYTSGVVITSPGGSSAAVSTFDPSRIVNVVSSNDSNQNITQQMEINVTLSNYSALKSQIQLSQLATNVTNNVQSALATSISH
ncbi:MAG: hypothetical protein KGO02_02135, partial [Alphaproteobacteria bacterium]|nr:hypothetical protein [Alphaproteobacteria bacterium]